MAPAHADRLPSSTEKGDRHYCIAGRTCPTPAEVNSCLMQECNVQTSNRMDCESHGAAHACGSACRAHVTHANYDVHRATTIRWRYAVARDRECCRASRLR